MYTATAAPGGATCTSETDRRGCIITGLTNGTEYVVSVTATNTAVGEGPGASSQVVVPSVLAPRLIGEYGGADNNAGIALALSEDGARTAIRTGDGVEVIAWNEGIGDFELVGSPITDMDLATNMEVQAVDISNDGNRLAIGDWAATNSSDVFSGIVKVFDWDENVEDWVQAGSTLEGSISQEDFGYAVDLSGDGSRLAVVAADTNNSAGVGPVNRVYEWDEGTSTWSQIGQDIDGGGRSTALSFDGEVLIVGHDGVLRFHWNGNQWQRFGQANGRTNADSSFGFGADLSGDGFVIAAADPFTEYVDMTSYSGALIGRVEAEDSNRDYFGLEVDLSRNGFRMFVSDHQAQPDGRNTLYEWDGDELAVIATVEGEVGEETQVARLRFRETGRDLLQARGTTMTLFGCTSLSVSLTRRPQLSPHKEILRQR